MSHFHDRRRFLLGALTLPFIFAAGAAAEEEKVTAKAKLDALEKDFGGRLGVFALNTMNGMKLSHRARERFAVCSTFKVLATSAILTRSAKEPALLDQPVVYQKADLVTYSPVTEKHAGEGMTVAELCAAALQYSDNTAANLLIKMLGGPEAVTAFARTTGNTEFRLDRWETELNTAIPGDPRDTATPESMAASLQQLLLGDALPGQPQRDRLRDWLCGNTTGAARIKAGIPADWKIGDKTGSGDYGTANDLAILWPPGKKPVILAVYTTQTDKDAKANNEAIAATARIVADWVTGG
jgi:beta-lactamase class A